MKTRLFVVFTNVAVFAAALAPWLKGLGKGTWSDGH